jgi:hypothetical protein
MQLVLAAAAANHEPNYRYDHLRTEYFYYDPCLKQYTLQR